MSPGSINSKKENALHLNKSNEFNFGGDHFKS
jgi:hypothetical protein